MSLAKLPCKRLLAMRAEGNEVLDGDGKARGETRRETCGRKARRETCGNARRETRGRKARGESRAPLT